MIALVPPTRAVMQHAITWFEIPAANLERAAQFYAGVLGRELTRTTINGAELAVFPRDGQHAVGGCVTTLATLRPSEQGSLVYLHVGADLEAALERSRIAGARILVGKTALPNGLGHYAHIVDSEGNRVGLHAA